jgi:hypothetical protein
MVSFLEEVIKSRHSFFEKYITPSPVLSMTAGAISIDIPLAEIPHPPEAVKKFRERRIRGPGDVRGRGNFLPPKQALISPWPARYRTHGSPKDPWFGFIRAAASCRRRSAEARAVLQGHGSPAGF